MGAAIVPSYRDVTGLSVSLAADLHVPQMKDGGHYFEDVVLTAVLDSCKHTHAEQVFHTFSPFLYQNVT